VGDDFMNYRRTAPSTEGRGGVRMAFVESKLTGEFVRVDVGKNGGTGKGGRRGPDGKIIEVYPFVQLTYRIHSPHLQHLRMDCIAAIGTRYDNNSDQCT
jgi:hypothetical protein